MAVSTVNLIISFSAGHLLCKLSVLIPGHIVLWILNTRLIEQSLVVIQQIVVITEWKAVQLVIDADSFIRSLIRSHINAALLHLIIQRHQLIFLHQTVVNVHTLNSNNIRCITGRKQYRNLCIVISSPDIHYLYLNIWIFCLKCLYQFFPVVGCLIIPYGKCNLCLSLCSAALPLSLCFFRRLFSLCRAAAACQSCCSTCRCTGKCHCFFP